MKPATITMTITRDGKDYAVRAEVTDKTTLAQLDYWLKALGRMAKFTLMYQDITGADEAGEMARRLEEMGPQGAIDAMEKWEKGNP